MSATPSESDSKPKSSEEVKKEPLQPDKNAVIALLQLLRKYNLKATEESLKNEAKLAELPSTQATSESDVSNVFNAYKSEGDPKKYEEAYIDLKQFIEGALDVYKHELHTVMYPVFVHMYLELVYNGHEAEAIKFLEKFRGDQEPYYEEDIKKIGQVTKKEHMKGNELIDTFTSNEFIIRMSRDALSIFKRHMQEKKQNVLQNVVQEHLYFDMYEGVARNKHQIDATAGAMIGEATRQDNKTKVYYGMPKEPDIQLTVPVEEEEDGDGGDADKPKKKKAKKDPLFGKKTKSDPNAPPIDRMPLPDLKDAEKLEKAKALREATKRVTLGAETLPSICCYTLLNTSQAVSCVEVCEDSSILGVGFTDSMIKLWSLVPQKLRVMKSAELLADVDMEAEDILHRIFDDRNAESTRQFFGHSGPIYRLSFSPDRTLLLSCSEDTTIRLWSLLTWTCLVIYKGHTFPVWDVKFSNHGYYFATASHDRTARLWATDQHQPLRVFAGHFSDVDCVQFHPNSNYIASGSSDRTVRLWDNVTGSQVRLMTGHKGSIYSLCFSVEGRFLASAGADANVLLWDLAHGHLLAVFSGHTASIHSLVFSREGNILASGSNDCAVKLWDFTKLTEEVLEEVMNVTHNPEIKKTSENYLLRTYGTKCSPVLGLHFTRRNVLLAVVTACGGLAAQSQGLGNARNSLRLAGRLLIAVCTDEHRSINRLEDCLWLSSYPAVVNATRSPWYNPQSREVRVRSVVKRILALLRRDDVYKAYTSAICVTGVVHFPVKYI